MVADIDAVTAVETIVVVVVIEAEIVLGRIGIVFVTAVAVRDKDRGLLIEAVLVVDVDLLTAQAAA